MKHYSRESRRRRGLLGLALTVVGIITIILLLARLGDPEFNLWPFFVFGGGGLGALTFGLQLLYEGVSGNKYRHRGQGHGPFGY